MKPLPKDLLEDVVLQATMEDMLTDDTIQILTDEILRIQNEEADDPAEIFRKKLDSVRKKKSNLVKALEEGTAAVVIQRIAELEEEEKDLQARIMREELKRPVLKREVIEGWLLSFRGGDVDDEAFASRLLDTFVAKVEVYNDMAVIYYNITDKRTASGVRIRHVCWSRRARIRTREPFVYKGYVILCVPLKAA